MVGLTYYTGECFFGFVYMPIQLVRLENGVQHMITFINMCAIPSLNWFHAPSAHTKVGSMTNPFFKNTCMQTY